MHLINREGGNFSKMGRERMYPIKGEEENVSNKQGGRKFSKLI